MSKRNQSVRKPAASAISSIGGVVAKHEDVDGAIKSVFEESRASGLPGDSGGPQDAYRHILISAELVRRKGEIKGPILAKAHEAKNRLEGQSAADSKMDDHNNAIGQEIGKKTKTWDDVVRMAREKIEEAAPHGGDGKNGRAIWHNKPEQPGWKPDFTDRPIASNKKGGEEHRQKTDPGRDPLEGEIGGVPGEEGADKNADAPAPHSEQAPAAEPAERSAADSPEARDMMARLSRGGETISEIIAKEPAKVTQGELDRVIGADLYRNFRDPLFEPANQLVVKWFDRVYAGLRSNADEPIAQSRIARRVTPSMTPDGRPVSDVAISIGRDLIDNAGGGNIEPEVIRLQSALNNVTPWHDTLKTDGVLGPKTHETLRSVLARDGIGPLQRAFFGG